MASKQPAMRPSDMPIADVLDRATGPRRAEAETLLSLHQDVSGEPPVVWAGRILGFGQLEYRYPTGNGGIAPILAFAPGPTRHTIYLPEHFDERWPDLMSRLGPYKASKVCLYLTRLVGVDLEVLRTLLELARDETLNSLSDVK